MNLKQHFLTKNDCYKAGKTITVKGLMLHSTGANNPKTSRYVGPDAGNWNVSGLEKCVHGFIGLDTDGSVSTYQTLPWNHRGWHAGGKANDTHIGVEICEDGLEDGEYFAKVYKEAVELFTSLCKQFNLTSKDIICHSEGFKLGVASNHADVMHWFPKHGKSMDTFRADVKKGLTSVIGAVKTVKAPVWEGTALKEGQIGMVQILRGINLWSRDENDKLTDVRVLMPGETYRVYGHDDLHGGQYNLGGNQWVTNMAGYVLYMTPSKELFKQAEAYYKTNYKGDVINGEE